MLRQLDSKTADDICESVRQSRIGRLVMDMTGTHEKGNGTSTELRSASTRSSTQSVDVTPKASGEEYKAQLEGAADAFVAKVLQDAKAATAAEAVEAFDADKPANDLICEVTVLMDEGSTMLRELRSASTRSSTQSVDVTPKASGEEYKAQLEGAADAFVQDAKIATIAEDDVDEMYLDSIASALVTQALLDKELYAAREVSLNEKVIEIIVAEIVVQELKTRVREDVEAAVSAAAAAEAAEATQVKALIQEEKSRMEQGAAAEAAALFAEECALQAEREEAQIKAAREALEKLAAATSQINSEAQAMAAAEAIIAALAAAAAMKAFKEEEARVRALFREARKEENLKKQRAEDPERRLREDMAAQQRLPVIG